MRPARMRGGRVGTAEVGLGGHVTTSGVRWLGSKRTTMRGGAHSGTRDVQLDGPRLAACLAHPGVVRCTLSLRTGERRGQRNSSRRPTVT